MNVEKIIKEHFEESVGLHKEILMDEAFFAAVVMAASLIKDTVRKQKKVLVAGNGGSAADAQHFVAELVGRFEKERKPVPAIALTTNASTITAISNDYSFETVFSRQILALGQKGDVFVGISTSGNSGNIIHAFETAKKVGIRTIGLLGNNGGKCTNLCDIPIIVPHRRTARIQEIHTLIIHAICDFAEREMKV